MLKQSRIAVPLLGVAVIAACVVALLMSSAHAGAESAKEVRWFVAHQPSQVFVRAEKLLADELFKRTGQAYHVTFLTPTDMGLKGTVSPQTIVDLIRDGKVDLVSMNIDSVLALEEAKDTSSLPDLEILHMPYLFRDYASADMVLDGAVGHTLLGKLDDIVPAHALAFTYSGGFRVIGSTKGPLANPADLKGLRINTWGSPTMEKSLASLGMKPIPVPVIGGGKDLIDSGKSDGVELTYTRADEAFGSNVKYVLETNHVLFLSALFVNNAFYASLSADARKVLDEAAISAAQVERADSIALNDTVRQGLVERGVSVVPLSPEARGAFEKWGADFRSSFAMTPGMRTLEQQIIDAQRGH